VDDGQRYSPTEIIRPIDVSGPIETGGPIAAEPGVLHDPGPRPPTIDRTKAVIVLIVVLVLLALVAALVRLLPGTPDDGPTGDDASGQPSPGRAAEAPDGDLALSDLEPVEPAEAAAIMRDAGIRGAGTVQQGWTWTDRNGFNLVTTSRATRGPADAPELVTLRVSHLANLDGKPRRLRLMQDPLSCDHRGRLRTDFTADSFRVSDLDGDGLAEVTVGWWFTCGDDRPDGTTVKLALISNGRKFIERGTGPGQATAEPGERVLAPISSFEPEPAVSRWPAPFLTQARSLLTTLHGSED
jgi:hypothetical protein